MAWLPGASTPQLGVSTCPHPSHSSRCLRPSAVLSGGWGAAHHWDSGNCFVDCVGVFVAGGQKVPALHVFQVRFSVFWVTTLNRFKITESPAWTVSGGLTWLSSGRSGGWSQAHSGAPDSLPGAEGLARHRGCTGSDPDVC